MLALLYAGCVYAALDFSMSQGGTGTLWPASGVFLAALLLSPRRAWLVITGVLSLINLVGELTVAGLPMQVAMTSSGSLAAQAFVSAVLIRRFTNQPLIFDKSRDVNALVGWGCIAVVSVASLPPAIVNAGQIPGSWVLGWLSRAVVSAAGIVVVTPLLMLWFGRATRAARSMTRRRWLVFGAALIGLALVTAVSFGTANPSGAALAPLSYLSMLTLILVAIFFTAPALSIAVFVFAAVAVYFDIQTSLDPVSLEATLLALQSFLFASAATALFISSLLRERESEADKLQQSRDRFELALQGSNDGIFDLDMVTGALYLSPRYKSMLGYAEDEIENTADASLALIHDEDRARVQEAFDNSCADPDVPFRQAFRMRHKNGGWVDILASGHVERDANGKPIRFAGTHSDQSEQNRIDNAIRQAERMETVGQLSGGIAHDFNNLLAVVMGNIELLRERVAKDSTAVDLAERANEAVVSAVSLTQKLLGFSRATVGSPAALFVDDVIRGMKDLLAKSLTAAIRIEYSLQDSRWHVVAEKSDLENAILNLALNARDAMRDGGTLTIETKDQQVDESFARLNPGVEPGDYVLLSVSDTGTGMTLESRNRAFEPFYTTKADRKGTGLGLSMVYGFVQRSRGYIKLYSEEGVGTTVRILLPRDLQALDAAGVDRRHEQRPPGGTETILVVDDEPMLLDLVVEFLARLGYRSLTAPDAATALKILEEEPEIHLLFSDVILPGELDGFKLAVKAREKHPALKILLTSGFTAKREQGVNGDEAFMQELATNLLSKPYNMSEMAFAIRKAIDEE